MKFYLLIPLKNCRKVCDQKGLLHKRLSGQQIPTTVIVIFYVSKKTHFLPNSEYKFSQFSQHCYYSCNNLTKRKKCIIVSISNLEKNLFYNSSLSALQVSLFNQRQESTYCHLLQSRLRMELVKLLDAVQALYIFLTFYCYNQLNLDYI